MTTTVTVSAHCDPETTEVNVIMENNVEVVSVSELQDGESQDFYAYDDQVIIVKEVAKTANGCAAETAA